MFCITHGLDRRVHENSNIIMRNKTKTKFSFSPEFQLEILRYIIKDKEGGLILKRIKPNYLVLIEHSIICEGIIKYYKKQNKIPSENVLKEVIKESIKKEFISLYLLSKRGSR